MSTMTKTEKSLAFVSFCIEEYKTRLGADGRKVADMFAKYGVLDYLLTHYDTLHTLGRDEILDDIDQFFAARVVRK